MEIVRLGEDGYLLAKLDPSVPEDSYIVGFQVVVERNGDSDTQMCGAKSSCPRLVRLEE